MLDWSPFSADGLPVRSIGVISKRRVDEWPRVAALRILAWGPSNMHLRTTRTLMIRSILGTPPEVVNNANGADQAKVATMLEHILPVAPRRLGLLNDAVVVSSLARYEPRDIKVPLLAISTADDRYGTFDGARYAAEHVPGAQFIGYPDGGHLCVGHTEDIIAGIAEYLTRHQ
jgi:2-hydroxy-6-oxonona-2,4-dienedioate hydrolase